MSKWHKLELDNYDNVVTTLNTLKLKREDVLTIAKDEKTNKITIIYYW